MGCVRAVRVLNSLQWEDLLFVPFLWFRLVIAEHEHVPSRGVPVEVAEEKDVPAFQRAFHHELGVVVDGVEFARGADPLAIQILAHQGAPVVADDDAVWVQHRHYFEHERVPEELGLVVVAHQEVDDPVHDEGRVAFARVDAGGQYDRLPHRDVHWVAQEVGYYEHVYVVAG